MYSSQICDVLRLLMTPRYVFDSSRTKALVSGADMGLWRLEQPRGHSHIYLEKEGCPVGVRLTERGREYHRTHLAGHARA
jgi:hypothetical protein